ncbi:MAG: hypothetical protein ACOYMN_03640, partial [Roseimicrobium sp.]
MIAFFQNLFAPNTSAPRWLIALVVLALAGAGYWYVQASLEHGNRTAERIDKALTRECEMFYRSDKEAMEKAGRPLHAYDLNDQRVYMNYAKGLREFHYDMYITRMRMPAFMYVLSLATDASMRQTDDASLERFYLEFYPKARAFNIGLSVVLLLAMFLMLRRWLGNWFGVAFTLVAAFQLFILKASYVQPEVMQTALITVTVAWVMHALHVPTWKSALCAGVLLCLWHLTKANALVALGLMGVTWGVKLLFASAMRERTAIVVAGLTTLAAYVVPMSPYLYKSWQTFGDPFYNVQSKYYMWATDVDDKHGLQRMGLDRNLATVDKNGDGKVDQPELLPSPGKYWREHSWKEIRDRLSRGTTNMFRAAYEEYTMLHLFQMLWAGVVVWAVARRWEQALAAWREWKWEILYVAALLYVFVYLFGWFTPLRVGPRLLNSISLMPIFCCMAATRALLHGDVIRVR